VTHDGNLYALLRARPRPGRCRYPEEEACEAAAELPFPHMRSEDDPGGDYEFDRFLQPDDLADPEDGVQLI
jgi:hypothetical protein